MIVESFGSIKNEKFDERGSHEVWIQKMQHIQDTSPEAQIHPQQWNMECSIDSVQIQPEDICPNLYIIHVPSYSSYNNHETYPCNYIIRVCIPGSKVAYEIVSQNEVIIRCVFALLLDNKDCTEEDIKEAHPEAFV